MLEPGATLQGRYTIDQMLGQGGRGIVYLARQELLGGRRVAIKETHFDFIMPEERQEAVAQFHREARLLASLEHENLVDVKDFFEEEGNLYLVMDFVEGETFEEILERSNGSGVPLDDIFLWADQICNVLECLHTHKPPIIFRDLKPGNIMLDHKGNVRLIDFGIARVLEPDSRDLTERAGTVGYAPYEQHAGKTPDARTDIYALGATLYDLVTGHPPPSAVAIRTGEESLEQPSELNPQVPSTLETVILKMMASKPEDRYQSVAEARVALRLAMKTAKSGRVRRVGLDDTAAAPRLRPLDDQKPTPKLSLTKQISQANQAPPPPPPPPPPRAVPPPAAPEPEAFLPPPQPEIKPKAGVFGWFRREPALDKAWLLDVENHQVKVDIKGYQDGVVTFISRYRVPKGHPMRFFMGLKNVSPPQYELGVQVVREDTLDEGGVLYEVAVSQMPPTIEKLLREQFPLNRAEGDQGAAARRAPRINTAFQVMSPELPGYKALSTNISLTGIQLGVREVVKVGTQLNLKLDFDDARFDAVKCVGQVMWCRPGEREWLIGIAFVQMSDEAKETVKNYMQFVSGPQRQVRM